MWQWARDWWATITGVAETAGDMAQSTSDVVSDRVEEATDSLSDLVTGTQRRAVLVVWGVLAALVLLALIATTGPTLVFFRWGPSLVREMAGFVAAGVGAVVAIFRDALGFLARLIGLGGR